LEALGIGLSNAKGRSLPKTWFVSHTATTSLTGRVAARTSNVQCGPRQSARIWN